MLILSKAKVTVRNSGDIRVQGTWQKHTVKIRRFFQDLPLQKGTVRLRFGHFVFSRNIDPRLQQRIRNFFFAECGM